jgi:hypothetical protein
MSTVPAPAKPFDDTDTVDESLIDTIDDGNHDTEPPILTSLEEQHTNQPSFIVLRLLQWHMSDGVPEMVTDVEPIKLTIPDTFQADSEMVEPVALNVPFVPINRLPNDVDPTPLTTNVPKTVSLEPIQTTWVMR